METLTDLVEKLEIDTSDIIKWSETAQDQLTPNSIDSTGPHQQTPDCYFQISLTKQHKRSKSDVYEYTAENSPVHHQSSPDLKLHVQKHSPHNKKRWFQLPRMTLKRQQSTPPKRGYGGLKAGLVEPPEPPPQLLFNLDWSTNSKSIVTASWETDVKHSASTPVTPVVSRRSSSAYPDVNLSDDLNSVSSSSTMVPEDDAVQLDHDILSVRRLSCPNYNDQEMFLGATPSKSKCCHSSSKLFSIIPIQRPSLKRGFSSESVPAVAQSSPSPSSPSSTASLSSTSTPPPSPPLSKNCADYKFLLYNVYVPYSNELVLNFKNIQPRTIKLKRRNNLKAEQFALHEWQTQLLARLTLSFSVEHRDHIISPAKKARYFLTRRFILQEFYTTEITFWNQLNFTKVMFCDQLKLALEKGSISSRPVDLDWFANLQDLMKFSSTLIRRLRQFQVNIIPCKETVDSSDNQTDQVNIGQALRDMTESMVAFLRCALDYKNNKKLLDQKKNNKGYLLYHEKLALRKETRQFTLGDYLIIPIQRVTRYGLLLTDLEKHTESTHPDYKNIRISLCIIQSLASAMNSAQN